MILAVTGLLAACWFMAGLMWLTQLVSYPVLAVVPAAQAPELDRSQQARLMALAMPATALALVSGATLALAADGAVRWLAGAAVVVLMAVGMLAGSVQSAQHQRLMKAFDARTHRRMVSGNWLTTGGWTVAALLSVAVAAAS